MNIRKFEPEDREELIALWRTVFPDAHAHNEPSLVLEEKLKVDDLVFIAQHEQKLIGACIAGYDGHRGWLYSVAVHPDSRRNGVGASLVRHAIAQLKTIGCNKVNIQIRATNTAVITFYEVLGFDTEERVSMGALL